MVADINVSFMDIDSQGFCRASSGVDDNMSTGALMARQGLQLN